jgi:hypothetical protein
MLAYEVTLDGEKIATAGMNDWSVMSVIISASRGSIEHGYKPNHTLHIGGLSQDTDSGAYHVRWKAPDLEIGSEILVRVIDCDHPDDPTRCYRSDKDVQENPFTEEEMREMRYQSYLDLKAEFEK